MNLIRRPELDNRDHSISAALRIRCGGAFPKNKQVPGTQPGKPNSPIGWERFYHKGELIARIQYNNEDLTTKVWMCPHE